MNEKVGSVGQTDESSIKQQMLDQWPSDHLLTAEGAASSFVKSSEFVQSIKRQVHPCVSGRSDNILTRKFLIHRRDLPFCGVIATSPPLEDS
jgi:hypothetical protein